MSGLSDFKDIYERVEHARLERKAESEIDQLTLEKIESATPSALHIPNIPGRGILPVILNLSSLFVPLNNRYKRQILVKEPLVHLWKMCDVKYSGYQLDESDRDVLMALIGVALKAKIGENIVINRRQLLKQIHPNRKSFGSSDYDWLWDSLVRLKFGILTIDLKYQSGDALKIGKRIAFSLLNYVEEDAINGKVVIQFDPRVAKLFERNQYTLINLTQRARLNMQLAKCLQSLISASKEIRQTYKLPFLIAKHGYHVPPHKVVAKLEKASKELIQAGIIEKYEWGKASDGARTLTFIKPEDPRLLESQDGACPQR